MRRNESSVPGAVITSAVREQLELEVVSNEARRQLTRLLRKAARAQGEDAHQIEVGRINNIVNLANTVLGRPIYTLELYDWDYHSAEYAWHYAQLELVLRRPDTPQLFEILVDLVDARWLTVDEVNAILEVDGVGARVIRRVDGAVIDILAVDDIPEPKATPDEHANVRKLIVRMDRAMESGDWSLVLHTAASAFETVAKQVVPNSNVQNRSLGSWFDLYRKHSKLTAPLLDAIWEIFQRRNIEPLAGHGSINDPSITEQEAMQVRELTVSLVRLERSLGNIELAAKAAMPNPAKIPNRPKRLVRPKKKGKTS